MTLTTLPLDEGASIAQLPAEDLHLFSVELYNHFGFRLRDVHEEDEAERRWLCFTLEGDIQGDHLVMEERSLRPVTVKEIWEAARALV